MRKETLAEIQEKMRIQKEIEEIKGKMKAGPNPVIEKEMSEKVALYLSMPKTTFVLQVCMTKQNTILLTSMLVLLI